MDDGKKELEYVWQFENFHIERNKGLYFLINMETSFLGKEN